MNGYARLLVAGWLIHATAAWSSTIDVLENGNSRVANAVSLDSYFSPNSNPNVFGTAPTATASSRIESASDVDWYSFTGTAGSRAWFDYDHLGEETESVLALFNGDGTLLAWSANSSPADPGSEGRFQSFLGVYTLGYSGTYYLAVAAYANLPTQFASDGSLTRPDGGVNGGFVVAGAMVGDDSFNNQGDASGVSDYFLHVSIDSSVPDSSQMVWPMALAFLGCLKWSFRRHQPAS